MNCPQQCQRWHSQWGPAGHSGLQHKPAVLVLTEDKGAPAPAQAEPTFFRGTLPMNPGRPSVPPGRSLPQCVPRPPCHCLPRQPDLSSHSSQTSPVPTAPPLTAVSCWTCSADASGAGRAARWGRASRRRRRLAPGSTSVRTVVALEEPVPKVCLSGSPVCHPAGQPGLGALVGRDGRSEAGLLAAQPPRVWAPWCVPASPLAVAPLQAGWSSSPVLASEPVSPCPASSRAAATSAPS